MRILFLSNFYPPFDIGGYEQWCYEVATRLQGRGHQVSVLTSRFGVQSGVKEDGQDVTRTLYLQADIDYYRPVNFFIRRPYQERTNIKELRQKIEAFQPDIIMVWGMWNMTLNLPYYAEKWFPGRVAYFISNYWPMDQDIHTQYWELPTTRALLEGLKKPFRSLALSTLQKEGYPPKLKLDRAVCCSKYVRDTLVEAGKLPPNAGVLFGGIDPEPFLQYSRLNRNGRLSGATPLRLLYFGRLIHDKGVHTAIEALGLLKQRGLGGKVELTILGKGHPDYELQLHTMVAQMDLRNHVKFADRVPRKEVPQQLGKFDIFLFTSIWPEPMARSVMEAMAAGLLVIGSEVGGQTEMLVNDQNALTFKSEDVDALANHISKVLKDPDLLHRLAKAGQQTALEQFTLERMINEIEAYLVQVHSDGTG